MTTTVYGATNSASLHLGLHQLFFFAVPVNGITGTIFIHTQSEFGQTAICRREKEWQRRMGRIQTSHHGRLLNIPTLHLAEFKAQSARGETD